MEAVTDFLFLSTKIIVDGDCSHEIKRHLLLGKKAMANLDRVLKSRDITFLAKACIVKAMFFPVVMYDVRARPQRRMSANVLMLSNCDAGEDS